jgi:hypothetical protein
MVYRGHIKNGVVEFEEPVPLPEGAEVDVIPSEPGNGEQSVEKLPEEEEEIPTLYERFKDFIGCIDDLPPDFAENHDHYIHGTPKR